ncbi:MAG: hypothetical protein ABS84_18025 [Rubrivivax sp. SCN 71-131]|nr:MAG: hypothetical protein ABS84_18025 [Rubrivivax sp. SCN 71-131]
MARMFGPLGGGGAAIVQAAVTRPDLDFRHAWTLALLGGLIASAAGVFLGVEVGHAMQEHAQVEAERLAVEPPRMVFDAVSLTQAHRRLAADVLGGSDALEPLREQRQRALDDAMERVAQVLSRSEAWALARADWREVAQRWQTLASRIRQRTIDVEHSALGHRELIEAELDVHDRLVDLLALAPGGPELALARRIPRLVQTLDRAPLAHEADRLALQAALGELLAAQTSWQRQQLAGRARQAQARVQRLAAGMAGMLALGMLGIVLGLRRRRSRSTPHMSAACVASASFEREPSPADVERELTAGLSRRAQDLRGRAGERPGGRVREAPRRQSAGAVEDAEEGAGERAGEGGERD